MLFVVFCDQRDHAVTNSESFFVCFNSNWFFHFNFSHPMILNIIFFLWLNKWVNFVCTRTWNFNWKLFTNCGCI